MTLNLLCEGGGAFIEPSLSGGEAEPELESSSSGAIQTPCSLLSEDSGGVSAFFHVSVLLERAD